MSRKIALLTLLVQITVIIVAQSPLNISEKQCKQASLGTLHSYAINSVLAQGTFYKVKISSSGVYKLSFEALTSMGLDPAKVRIFGYGGGVLEQDFTQSKPDDLPEISIWMEKGTDGVFNAGDYVLFYAQGINRWSYNKSKAMFTHLGNTYSDGGYYFVTSGEGIGKHIQEKLITIPSNPTIHPVTEFVDYQVHERDLISLANTGKEFYGGTFNDGTNHKYILSFPNPVLAENSVKLNLDVAAFSPSTSSFILNLNGTQHKTLDIAPQNYYDIYEKAKQSAGIFTFTPQNNAWEFNMTYSKPAPTSVAYLNYIEVNARRHLTMTGSAMQFQNIDYLGMNTYNQYRLSNDKPNVQLWDITDQLNITKIITENIDGKMCFTDSGNEVKHYLAIDPTDGAAFPSPEIIGVVPNQNIHAIPQADMVIITHPNFLTQAETLAQAHRQMDNMSVTVVTTEQVYNEFSSGTPDATAYRWTMKMFYDRALSSGNSAQLPKYLLLIGKGSFDNRKILANSGENLVLTYQADKSLSEVSTYVTDDYFTYLEDSEGQQLPSHSMDIAVGRFPVTTTQQANDVVNKTIGYMNNSDKGRWKKQLCFIGDDGDMNTYMLMSDSLARDLSRRNASYDVKKIYSDAFKKESTEIGERYPIAKDSLMNSIQEGLFLLNYTGQGGIHHWAKEQILTNSDIITLKNDHLPLWIAATADFVKFDTQEVSAGENVLLNPTGGGIGVFSAARPTYVSQNFRLNDYLIKNLFAKENGQHLRVGEAIRKAKNSLGSEINKLSFIYLGDPALQLNYADNYKVITTKINDKDSFGNDTIKAQASNTIQGCIMDGNSNKAISFNGKLHIKLYDKTASITTLRNDTVDILKAFTYNDRPTVLYSGEAPVVNGEFSYTLALPKAMEEQYGVGRISYYAEDDTNNLEAMGSFEEFIVGGTDLTAGIILPGGEDSSLVITVTNYPNPASEQTYFIMDHYDNIVSCSIDIYDVSGRTIHSITSTGQDKITWDLSTNNGQRVVAGIYFYRARIKTTDKDIHTKANRIIIID